MILNQDSQNQQQQQPATRTIPMIHRDTLNGCWILDKTRGEWSMKQYLEVMNVDILAIEANCKGEIEYDTIQSIEFMNNNNIVKIIKRSRVNNDIIIELQLNGEDHIEYLPPGNRIKKTIAITDNDLCYLNIKTNLNTMNGYATVIDIKRLIQEDKSSSVLVQELTLTNDDSGRQHTTTRYFNPIPNMDYYESNNVKSVDQQTTA